MNKKLLCIVGPTGVGKNKIALEIARKFNGEIINCDSRQIFKGLPIITAQPTEEEKEVCPHHLYGFLGISDKIDAAKFSQIAEKVIEKVLNRRHLPILVGGTGLYLKAILEGLAPIPDIPIEIRNKILNELKEKGSIKLYQRLKEIDPEAADKIHPNDWQRISRALEVFELTGKPISWWQKSYLPKSKYNYLKVGLKMDLNELKKKLWYRIEDMIHQGAIEEIKSALNDKIDFNSPIWSSIGCKELLMYINGNLSLEEAKWKWFKYTKDYARRQIFWFKKEKDIKWFHPKELNTIIEYVKKWLLN